MPGFIVDIILVHSWVYQSLTHVFLSFFILAVSVFHKGTVLFILSLHIQQVANNEIVLLLQSRIRPVVLKISVIRY